MALIAAGYCKASQDVIEALLGPGANVKRLVLEIGHGMPVTVYVERFVERDALAACAAPLRALAGRDAVDVVECDHIAIDDKGRVYAIRSEKG